METTGKGEVIPVPQISGEDRWAPYHDDHHVFSTRFQWLPCEVAFKTGEVTADVEIISYINNLPPTPENKPLYRAIEKAISLSIEPWNQVLMRGERSRVPYRIPCHHDFEASPSVFEDPDFDELFIGHRRERLGVTDDQLGPIVEKARKYWETVPDEPMGEWVVERDCGVNGASTFDEVYERFGLEKTALIKHRLSRRITIPDVGDTDVGDTVSYEEWAASPERYAINLEKEFRKKGLQVIVKLASIELTPDKPSYPGGSWHLEGLLNERIVATSILYYDVENVTPSRINFRFKGLAEMDVNHEQEDFDPMAVIWGAVNGEKSFQNVGSIPTPARRLLAFPNTLQHRVDPFELEDKTKPGHRRLLVLWLVDPTYRIASTRNVPPQQQNHTLDNTLSGLGGRLPPEVVHQVHENLEYGMTEDEAKVVRLELMDERTKSVEEVLDRVNEYNFCEH